VVVGFDYELNPYANLPPSIDGKLSRTGKNIIYRVLKEFAARTNAREVIPQAGNPH
jgi:hypothetical protein